MIPVFVNYPETMLRVRVAAMKEASEAALADLQELGVLHVEEARELSPSEIAGIASRRRLVGKAVQDIDEILGGLRGVREVHIQSQGHPLDPDEAINRVEVLKGRLSSHLARRDDLRQKISSMATNARYLDSLAGEMDVRMGDLHYDGPYLFSRVIVLAREVSGAFLDSAGPLLLHRLVARLEGEDVIYLLAREGDRERIGKVAANLGGSTLPQMDGEISLREFNRKRESVLAEMSRKLGDLEDAIQLVIEEHLDRLVLCRDTLERERSRLDIMEMAATARYMTLFEGWVPESGMERLSSGISRRGGQVFVDSRPPGPEDTPPTRMNNPEGIRPFQVIVKLFGIPRYGDWDPTPSIAYFFAFFFGLMLNDIAYAAGLLLIAWRLVDKLVEDPGEEGVALFKRVLVICGVVSLVTGVLSGTFMGDFFGQYLGIPPERLALAGVVQAALADPITFILISLVIGLVHLNIAHMLSLVRGVRERSPGLVVNKLGLFAVQIFGIPYLFHVMLNIDLLPFGEGAYTVMGYLLALGVLGVVAGSFLMMGSLGSIFWVFDLTGILGDVMSYSRLAGVGLASYYLASSFNLLSNWVAGGLGGAVPGVLGTVLGFLAGLVLLTIFHVFNLLLSALAAFIHSLRLCFVEFLLKFYEAGGREYSPFQAPHRRTVLVGRKIP